MPGRATYEFSVIRVVPRVEREEFLNVGVILFSKPKDFLALKYRVDEKRLLPFSGDLDIGLIKNHLLAWERVCRGGPEGGPIGEQDLPYRFRWLAAPKSTILQCSRPHPGLCNDPQQVLDALFNMYVAPVV